MQRRGRAPASPFSPSWPSETATGRTATPKPRPPLHDATAPPWPASALPSMGGGGGIVPSSLARTDQVDATVVGLLLGTWHADSEAVAGSATAAAAAVQLTLTLTCWGQMKRPLDAHIFTEMVKERMGQFLWGDAMEAEKERGAVRLSFPRGVPRHLEQAPGEPQLVIDVHLRLANHLQKGTQMLIEMQAAAEVVARALGEATGVDSVDCRLGMHPNDEQRLKERSTLEQLGAVRHVVYQRKTDTL